MPEKLSHIDSLDVRILEALGTLGPRNIKKVADTLGMHVETVRRRIKRMSSLFYLRVPVAVYHTYLGLKKAVVIAQANLGYEDLLFDCLKLNPFYYYLTRCYGMFEGCFAIYTIPIDHCTEFTTFLQEIEKLGVAKKFQVFWSTCFHTINGTPTWFNHNSEAWTFPWDQWIKDIPNQQISLPYTLIDPKDFPMKAEDELDLRIIAKLEVDGKNSLTKMGKMLNTTSQNIRYHYQEHILSRGLIEKFQIFIFPFDRDISLMFWFIFRFDKEENMARFALSLIDKPFANVVGKILGEYMLVAQIYLPILEFRHFTESLSQLCRNRLLKSYEYLIQDLRKGKWSRQTIPYEHLKGLEWIYNHDQHIEDLRKIVGERIF
jgi:DNA-binding Lrp family transcriptional regulator